MFCKDKLILKAIEQKEFIAEKINESGKRFLRIDVRGTAPEKLFSLINDLQFITDYQNFEFTLSGGIMKIPLGQY